MYRIFGIMGPLFNLLDASFGVKISQEARRNLNIPLPKLTQKLNSSKQHSKPKHPMSLRPPPSSLHPRTLQLPSRSLYPLREPPDFGDLGLFLIPRSTLPNTSSTHKRNNQSALLPVYPPRLPRKSTTRLEYSCCKKGVRMWFASTRSCRASNGPYYGPYKVNRNGHVFSTNVLSSYDTYTYLSSSLSYERTQNLTRTGLKIAQLYSTTPRLNISIGLKSSKLKVEDRDHSFEFSELERKFIELSKITQALLKNCKELFQARCKLSSIKSPLERKRRGYNGKSQVEFLPAVEVIDAIFGWMVFQSSTSQWLIEVEPNAL
ncbi:uncharacterized protein BDR25DRAFT_355829 [Lindgomyces ingoldianus]|uniref:Uncharacterized protein n=1 Tax=Lindgomyces ingoldianus TaxID=673940 RepID=A0ACB6QSY3_9PLEO|nr:uncharacterized protein BDR25DRAFT_355829 [Lindgomyces ingoldianus]KAF2470118.1 hypothetical protein BDR25DRAFT_355829 [Lindgomyces ingoldianus]